MPSQSISQVRNMIPQLIEYFPLIALLQNVGLSQTLDARAIAIVAVLRFLSSKTDTPLDNEFLEKLEPVLRTPQGVDLTLWLGKKVQEIVEGERIARETAGQAVA